MKQKFLLALLFACTITFTTNAQIKKGALWLGGSIGYSYSENDPEASAGSKARTIAINPGIGTAIEENLIAGVYLNYINGFIKHTGSQYEVKDRAVGGGFFVRKYVPIVKQLYIFGEGAATYRRTHNKVSSYGSSPSTSSSKGWDAGISISPGVSFAVTKSLHLESGFNSLFSAVYQKRRTQSDNSETQYTKSFTAGISAENESQLYIGFRFLFNNKG